MKNDSYETIETKEEFYSTLKEIYPEEEIKELEFVVNTIEEKQLNMKNTYNLVKYFNPRSVNLLVAISYFNEKENAFLTLASAYKKIRRDTLKAYKNSVINNTMNEFVKGYTPDDFLYLENTIYHDDIIFTEDEKELYISELKYLSGEIEYAVPKVNVRKKVMPHLEEE